MRVTIVGAGIIGLSIAWELAQRNIRVKVIDRGAAGRQTSWAAAGILPAARQDTADDPLGQLRGFSHELYPRWAQTLAKYSNIDSGLRHCGGIYLARTSGEAASLIANAAYQHELGIEASLLSVEQLVAKEPALQAWAASPQFKAALWSPDEYQIRPPDHLESLVAACRVVGVRIEEYSQATLNLCGDSSRAGVCVRDPAGTETRDDADRIIVCGGAWTGQLAARFGLSTSIIPIRGQMLLYRFSIPCLDRIVNEGHRYLVPRDDGRLLVGSCEEEVGFQPGTTAEMLQSLARWAESILPALASMNPENSWSALRPATFDAFPLIGKVPDVENLYVASGHYRSGIHLAPATAVVLADTLQGITPAVDLAAFGVGRMIERQ